MAKLDTDKVEGKVDAPEAPRMEPVIVDLGKQNKKKIRRLRKGKGTLFSKVLETHSELRAHGAGDGNSPIIVVVNEKKRRRLRWGRLW
jgi:Family of unknown function (DUF6200)